MTTITNSPQSVNSPPTTYSSRDECAHKIEQCYYDNDAPGMYKTMGEHPLWQEINRKSRMEARIAARAWRLNDLMDLCIDEGLS